MPDSQRAQARRYDWQRGGILTRAQQGTGFCSVLETSLTRVTFWPGAISVTQLWFHATVAAVCK